MKNFLLLLVLVMSIPATSWASGALVEDKHGCKLVGADAEANETLAYDWKGKCKAGYAEGKGILLIDKPNHPYKKETVTFHKGLREGHSTVSFLAAGPILRMAIDYTHGERNGKSVAYLMSGDVLERNFVDGQGTNHYSLTKASGDHFEIDDLPDGSAFVKAHYANGNVYEGDMVEGARNGKGKFTRKGEPPQVGDFILDEFINVKDEAVRDLMPIKFDLELGMTKDQVEALTGTMMENTSSTFRNAYTVAHFPNEKISAPNMMIGERTVYFDDEGKLWRIWAKIFLKEDTLFGGGEVMQAYGTFKKWLVQQGDLAKSVQPYPHYREDISSCNGYTNWEKDDPGSFGMAQKMAPMMAHSQRVIFDIGCGAIGHWLSTYASKDGKERYTINIRDGNLYATPLTYTVAVANEEEMYKKLAKAVEKK